MTKVNDFQECLDFSHDHKNEPFWEKVYDKAFPDMEWCKPCIEKGQGQYLGIDRIIYLVNGKILTVDEKLRKKVYPDILLEYLSNDRTDAPGWMQKPLHIDYLAYAFLPTKRCYLFDWQMLRRAWLHHKEEWFQIYRKVPSKNPGYKTWSLAIPTKVLLDATKRARIIQV